MKKNFKNSTIFNYQYLDTLVEYLKKETADQESKIALLRRVLTALAAAEQGERHEHYKTVKKNLTEHKAIEYIIELLIKKEYPALQQVSFDYSKGIFEILRVHKDIIKDAAIHILNGELSSFVALPTPSLESFKTQDIFDHYTILLNNLLEIRQLGLQELEPLITQSCEHASNHISIVCDQLKEAFYGQTFTDAQFALRVAYMLDLHQNILADVWGGLRLNFLRLHARKHAVSLLQSQKAAESQAEIPHTHSDSCTCQGQHE